MSNREEGCGWLIDMEMWLRVEILWNRFLYYKIMIINCLFMEIYMIYEGENGDWTEENPLHILYFCNS